jgi:hypothetical protein
MPRVLDVRRVQVAPAQQPAYRAAAAAVAARCEARDAHFWLFRSRSEPVEFVEFVEGPGPESPRARLTDHGEQALLETLQRLARHHDDGTLWDAVTLTSGAGDGATDR